MAAIDSTNIDEIVALRESLSPEEYFEEMIRLGYFVEMEWKEVKPQ